MSRTQADPRRPMPPKSLPAKSLPAMSLRAIRFWEAVAEEERLCDLLAAGSADDRRYVEAAIAERRGGRSEHRWGR